MPSHLPWKSSDDRWRLWPALVLILVPFLGLIGILGYEALSRLPRADFGQRLVAHGFKVTMTAQSLRSALQDAEHGQRGYLRTGRPVYLKSYRAAIANVPRLVATLTRLTAGDPRLQRRLPGLRGQIDLKLEELQRTTEAYRGAGPSAALRIVKASARLHEMASIEGSINAMTAAEDRLLSQRLAKLAAQDRMIQRMAIVSAALASLLMLFGLILARLNYRKGVRLQRELARHATDLAQSNQALAQRNAELAHATELARAAQEEARQAERAKGRFLATASHDLRQPLQAVSLLNGALRRTARDPDVSAALRQQHEAIGAMSRLLNTLLDISKLESGAVKPAPADFSVSALLEALAREFRDVAASKGLELHLEACEAWAHSDPSLLEQILRNLLSNALKYTRAGWVRLRAAAAPPWINIEVIDSGVGIPQDQIGLLGAEFYQIGVPSNSTREGYGLGLSIVRRLVRLLELELDIRSEIGTGSTFSLRVRQSTQPASTAQAQPSPALARAAPAGESARILLVEDDTDVRIATRMLLKAEGYIVTAAASSLEALQRAREDRSIALVVTDYHLGAGDTGLQVILRLREILSARVKAVLITGDTSSAIRDLAPDPDLRIVSKPVQAEVFLGLVRELLAA